MSDPTDWTPEKPTTPGLYHWCDGVSKDVFDVWINEGFTARWRCGKCFGSGYLRDFTTTHPNGYWRPVPTPSPFIKPVPPKVEPTKWEGELVGQYVLVHEYKAACVVFDKNGQELYAVLGTIASCGGRGLSRLTKIET